MSEALIATPQGRLFAQRWPGAAAGLAPILLFHDSLGSVGLWRDLPAALAQATRREVIAYDRLGFGRSDRHPGRLPLDFVAAEARDGFAALRAALRIGRFVTMGHSVGGGMAVEAAAAFPQDCVAVVTIAAQFCSDEPVRAGIRAAQAGFAQPGALDRLARHHGDKAAWVLEAWTGTWLSPAFCDSFSLDAALARLRCPLLVIHGEDDEYGDPSHARRIAEGGGGTLALLPGHGHLPHRDDPEGVVQRVTDFLAGLP